jgi:hypothetical protein
LRILLFSGATPWIREAMARIDFIDATDDIDATAEDVFALLLDVDRWPTWATGVSRAWRRPRGPFRVGVRIGFVPRFLPVPIDVPVLEFEQDRRLVWGVRTPFFEMVHGFTIEPLPGGRCRVRHREHAEGLLALLTRPMAQWIRRFDRGLSDDLAVHFATRT